MAAPKDGLRERKKRATRDAIASTARRLFAERPAGISVLDVFRANSEAMLDTIAAGAGDDRLVVPRIVRDSPTLQKRMAAGWEREAAALVAAIAEATGARDDDL